MIQTLSQLSPEESLVHPFAPKIVKELPKTTVSQDQAMVKFEVKVVGHPKPEIKWLKAGEEIIPSDEFQIENLEDGTSILVINDVYPDDTGIIKCEAFNSVGVAETVTEFIVEGIDNFWVFFSIFFNCRKIYVQDLQLSCFLLHFHCHYML